MRLTRLESEPWRWSLPGGGACLTVILSLILFRADSQVFHTEEGGSGNANPDLNGPGMPPNEDPPSWSTGLSMQRVNDVANMWGCQMGLPSKDPNACVVDADADGFVSAPKTTKQLCDRVVADDAVLKLRLAAQNLNATGQPFFLAAGWRATQIGWGSPTSKRPLVTVI